MYTNEAVRKAMGGLVSYRGEKHKAQAYYMNHATGHGECFLGALCEFMGKVVPAEGVSARHILGHGAVSPEMATAFQIAQHLNDSGYEWKYVLLGVDLVLEKDPRELAMAVCPCSPNCEVSSGVNFASIRKIVDSHRALDRSREPKFDVSKYATGGLIKPSFPTIDLDKITASFGQLSAAFQEVGKLQLTVNAGVVTGSFESVAAKKDHALVA